MSRAERLWVVLVANLALVGALVGVGVGAHSLGVWAEGADYLADAAATGLSLLALHLASRPSAARRRGGHVRARAPHYAALANAGWLLVLSLLVAAGACDRLVEGVQRVEGLAMLAASGVAALVMLGGAVLLRAGVDAAGDADDNDGVTLSLRAVLLDTAADAAAAAGVAVAGGVIAATHGFYWLDPAVALLVAVVVGYHALRLVLRVRVAIATAATTTPAPTGGGLVMGRPFDRAALPEGELTCSMVPLERAVVASGRGARSSRSLEADPVSMRPIAGDPGAGAAGTAGVMPPGHPRPGELEEAMRLALEEAAGAAAAGDVPVGAVVLLGGTVVARRHNERELAADPTAHAEVLALRDAAAVLGRWRLQDCTLVVTLEPCPMCAGAAVAARVGRLAFGAADHKSGACGSLYNLCVDPRLNHEVEVVAGVLAGECGEQLTRFFAQRRGTVL